VIAIFAACYWCDGNSRHGGTVSSSGMYVLLAKEVETQQRRHCLSEDVDARLLHDDVLRAS